MANKPKILLYDIETSPNLGFIWGKYEQNVIEFKKQWELLSFAYKWLGEDTVHCLARPHYKDKTEVSLVKDIWELFDEADVLVAHNGNAFDYKKCKAKFIEHGLKPPSLSKTVDTKLIARQAFNFNSNSLNDLGQTLKLGKKLETGGFQLWLDCMAGKKKAWKQMIAYNKQDVILLEKVYLKLRAWAPNHPNLAMMQDRAGCPACGSEKTFKRGFIVLVSQKKQRHQCQDCGHWFSRKIEK